jgi:hypothetical protein
MSERRRRWKINAKISIFASYDDPLFMFIAILVGGLIFSALSDLGRILLVGFTAL